MVGLGTVIIRVGTGGVVLVGVVVDISGNMVNRISSCLYENSVVLLPSRVKPLFIQMCRNVRKKTCRIT